MFKNDSLSFKSRTVKRFYDSFLRIFISIFHWKENTLFLDKISIKRLIQIFLELLSCATTKLIFQQILNLAPVEINGD